MFDTICAQMRWCSLRCPVFSTLADGATPPSTRDYDDMKWSPRLVIGLAGAIFSLGAFFFFMQYFGLFNSVILYRDPMYMTKLLLAQFFIPLALFLAVGSVGGYRAGLTSAAGMIALLSLAYILRLLTH